MFKNIKNIVYIYILHTHIAYVYVELQQASWRVKFYKHWTLRLFIFDFAVFFLPFGVAFFFFPAIWHLLFSPQKPHRPQTLHFEWLLNKLGQTTAPAT